MSGEPSCGDKCCKRLTDCCNYNCCICCLVEDWATEDNQWENEIRNRDCCNYCCCHNCCCTDGGQAVYGCGWTLSEKHTTCSDGCRRCLFWFLPCCVPCCVMLYEYELGDKETGGGKRLTRCILSSCGFHCISACMYGCCPIKLSGKKRKGDNDPEDPEDPVLDVVSYSDRSSIPLISPKSFVT